jgi:hypothetical protein
VPRRLHTQMQHILTTNFDRLLKEVVFRGDAGSFLTETFLDAGPEARDLEEVIVHGTGRGCRYYSDVYTSSESSPQSCWVIDYQVEAGDKESPSFEKSLAEFSRASGLQLLFHTSEKLTRYDDHLRRMGASLDEILRCWASEDSGDGARGRIPSRLRRRARQNARIKSKCMLQSSRPFFRRRCLNRPPARCEGRRRTSHGLVADSSDHVLKFFRSRRPDPYRSRDLG